MFRRTSLGYGLLVLLFPFVALAEKPPSAANSSDLIEFPVTMQEKVAAGITKVGTTVHAKITISTLVHGTVVPRDAVLSGEVIASEAKSADAPSKLGIRMDLVQWKNGSLPIKVYLTEWYYPLKPLMSEDGNPGYSSIHGSVGVTMGGGTPYPGSTLPPSASTGGRRLPDDDPAPFPTSTDPTPSAASTDTSTHRTRMQDVESKRADDGSILLIAKKTSLKLDKSTTYVFAAGNLLPQK